MERRNFMGLDSFVWFIGIVENRLDPLRLNRCQVRCFGWHTEDKSAIPTADLPWAQPMLPVNGSFASDGPKEGDMVVGFFTDGSSGQFPIIFGVLPGIPDNLPPIDKGFSDPRTEEQLKKAPKKPKSRSYPVNGNGGVITEGVAKRYPDVLNEPTTSRVARNESIEKTLIKERKDNIVTVPTYYANWIEPTSKYNAVFPYNEVKETESGHLFEIDDTPLAERISKAHRSGTFEEIHPDGSKVTKIIKDNYEIVMANNNVYVMGNCNVTIQGNAELYIKGNYSTKVDGDYKLKVMGNYYLDIFKSSNIRYEKDHHLWYGDDTYTKAASGHTDYGCPTDRDSDTDCADVPGL
jgi:hypothetical protein